MRQLAQRGLEVLDKEEINMLQKNLISLKRQYDSLLNESDRLLRRLLTAVEELQKFKVKYILFLLLHFHLYSYLYKDSYCFNLKIIILFIRQKKGGGRRKKTYLVKRTN